MGKGADSSGQLGYPFSPKDYAENFDGLHVFKERRPGTKEYCESRKETCNKVASSIAWQCVPGGCVNSLLLASAERVRQATLADFMEVNRLVAMAPSQLWKFASGAFRQSGSNSAPGRMQSWANPKSTKGQGGDITAAVTSEMAGRRMVDFTMGDGRASSRSGRWQAPLAPNCRYPRLWQRHCG